MKKIIESEYNSAKIAADFLKEGKIICFAADTVYGLAVDAQNEDAVEKLYRIKKREKNKPIAIFIADSSIAKKLFIFNNIAEKIVKNFFPGYLTLVLKKLAKPEINLAKNLNHNDDFLGFRIVNKKFINELFKNFPGILAVTSANISGNKSAISASEINLQEIDLLIDGGICEGKTPSTVIKILDNKIILLREGAIDFETINNSL